MTYTKITIRTRKFRRTAKRKNICLTIRPCPDKNGEKFMNNEVINYNNSSSYMHIFFSISGVLYSVPVYCVVEILQFCQLQAPQKLQKYCIGLLDYNGLMLNVIDIREILGLEQKPLNMFFNSLIRSPLPLIFIYSGSNVSKLTPNLLFGKSLMCPIEASTL